MRLVAAEQPVAVLVVGLVSDPDLLSRERQRVGDVNVLLQVGGVVEARSIIHLPKITVIHETPVHVAARHVAHFARLDALDDVRVAVGVPVQSFVVEAVDRQLDGAAFHIDAETVEALAIDVFVVAVHVLLDEVRVLTDGGRCDRQEDVVDALVAIFGRHAVDGLLPDLLVVVVLACEPTQKMFEVGREPRRRLLTVCGADGQNEQRGEPPEVRQGRRERARNDGVFSGHLYY